MRTLLLIDDDAELYSLIHEYMTSGEFRVEHAGSAETGLSRLFNPSENWDAVILDVMLPGITGFEALRRLRHEPKTRSLPVLMLTALDSERERVAGLDSGADDYLVKPFSLAELAARKWKSAKSSKDVQTSFVLITLDYLVIERSALAVEVDGRHVRLTPAEMRLLEALAANPGKTVRRDCLNQTLSGIAGLHNARGLDMAVSRLRKKLGRRRSGGERIQAVWGEGYVFLLDGEKQ